MEGGLLGSQTQSLLPLDPTDCSLLKAAGICKSVKTGDLVAEVEILRQLLERGQSLRWTEFHVADHMPFG